MTAREKAHAEGFDFHCFHLLCNAVKWQSEHAAGNTFRLCPETFGPHRQTVFFLGSKSTAPKPTRKERGCFVK